MTETVTTANAPNGDVADAPAVAAAATEKAPAPSQTASSDDAVAAERARVQGILAEGRKLKGHDDIVQTCIAEGKTPGECASMILAAEAAKPPAALAEMRTEIPGEARPAAPAASTAMEQPARTGDPVVDARATWDADANVRAEFGGSFERYEAFTKAKASGRVRLLSHPPEKDAA